MDTKQRNRNENMETRNKASEELSYEELRLFVGGSENSTGGGGNYCV